MTKFPVGTAVRYVDSEGVPRGYPMLVCERFDFRSEPSCYCIWLEPPTRPGAHRAIADGRDFTDSQLRLLAPVDPAKDQGVPGLTDAELLGILRDHDGAIFAGQDDDGPGVSEGFDRLIREAQARGLDLSPYNDLHWRSEVLRDKTLGLPPALPGGRSKP